jgi:hypothetical protein
MDDEKNFKKGGPSDPYERALLSVDPMVRLRWDRARLAGRALAREYLGHEDDLRSIRASSVFDVNMVIQHLRAADAVLYEIEGWDGEYYAAAHAFFTALAAALEELP